MFKAFLTHYEIKLMFKKILTCSATELSHYM